MVEEGTDKCFQESLLEHQVMRMTYAMQDKDVLTSREKPTECKISVLVDGQVVKEHALLEDNHEGVLAHAAQVEGPHMVCVACKPQGWFEHRKLRWSIAFDVLGASRTGDLDVEKIVSLAHVKGTQTGLQTVLDRVGAIFSENEYEKSFESKFIKTSDRVNTDVSAFKLLQILLVACVTAFQVGHLSQFLRRSCLGCLPFMQPKEPQQQRPMI